MQCCRSANVQYTIYFFNIPLYSDTNVMYTFNRIDPYWHISKLEYHPPTPCLVSRMRFNFSTVV